MMDLFVGVICEIQKYTNYLLLDGRSSVFSSCTGSQSCSLKSFSVISVSSLFRPGSVLFSIALYSSTEPDSLPSLSSFGPCATDCSLLAFWCFCRLLGAGGVAFYTI